jgi:trimeric autotransporter adhesin
MRLSSFRVRGSAVCILLFAAALASGSPIVPSSPAAAAGLSTDLVGPAGSQAFGSQVVVLSNGNFVVSDYQFDSPTAIDVGAVYLFDGVTGSLISTTTGSTANDKVGRYGVQEVGSSNFVIGSANWDNGAVADAGASTWVSGTVGLNAAVGPSNSLVGSTLNDQVGRNTIVLTNGNYVLATSSWSNGAISSVGAITWVNGESGAAGPVTLANSIVGSSTNDLVGDYGVTPLTNGNYVVASPTWKNGSAGSAGAATWASGTGPTTGPVSAANSLVGTSPGDSVGRSITALTNGNYVVSSPSWKNGSITQAGAATWGNGTTGTQGPVTTANSLTGSITNDQVGQYGSTPLTNGNYVVISPFWDGGASGIDVGAVTWGNGATGTTGSVGTGNSLVGSTAGDRVGANFVTALTNGNYVIVSPFWSNGAAIEAGAATWRNGSAAAPGVVALSNSLVGSSSNDQVGSSFAVALTNGNYVISSPGWDNGALSNVGASTWGNGATGTVGPVAATNSLVGATVADGVSYTVTPLTNGNYVVSSPNWDKPGLGNVGAVTLANGVSGAAGPVTAANSLTGSTPTDQVGYSGVSALTNGNYAVASAFWDAAGTADVGAVTFVSGATGLAGAVVSSANSLVGSQLNDKVGLYGVSPSLYGNYAVVSPVWDRASSVDAGAVTYAPPSGIVGAVSLANSAVGTLPGPVYSVSQRATAANNLLVATGQNRVLVLPIGAPPDVAPVAPGRLADTRPGAATIDGAFAGGGVRPAGSTLELVVAGRGGVPADAAAAALNVTAVDPGAAGYVTVFPCGSPMPTASNLNFASANVPNAATTKIGAGGKVCIFTSAATQLIVDVNGFFPSTGRVKTINPARLIDSRPGAPTVDGLQAGGGVRGARSVTTVQVTGRASVPANAAAVVLNVTVASAQATGFITVFPCGTPVPVASNINYVAGSTIAGLVVSKLGAGGTVCMYAEAGTHLLADVSGYVPAISTYTAIDPARLLDTRPGSPTVDGQGAGAGLRPAGSTTEIKVVDRVGVPTTTETVVLNVTVTGPTATGYITVYPCGSPQPTASNLNFTAGTTIANAVISKVGADGKVCLFNSDPTQLLADINGFFKPGATPWFFEDNRSEE